jgi:hypothetical protein
MSIYNKFTLPIADAISDALGMVSGRWRLFFQNQLSLNNSLTSRWVRQFSTPITVSSATVLRKNTSLAYTTYLFPIGSRVMVNQSGMLFGIVEDCTYDSGASDIVLTLRMDGGTALTAVTEIYYSVLTSSVID